MIPDEAPPTSEEVQEVLLTVAKEIERLNPSTVRLNLMTRNDKCIDSIINLLKVIVTLGQSEDALERERKMRDRFRTTDEPSQRKNIRNKMLKLNEARLVGTTLEKLTAPKRAGRVHCVDEILHKDNQRLQSGIQSLPQDGQKWSPIRQREDSNR